MVIEMDTQAHLAMDIAYVMGAICIVYKLAYFIRQLAHLPDSLVCFLRIVALVLGTLIAFRAVHVFEQRSHIGPFDVAVQFAWCALMAAVIISLGRRRKVW